MLELDGRWLKAAKLLVGRSMMMSPARTRLPAQDYFAERAAQERDRAERSLDPAVRRVHQELAERYSAQIAANDRAA
jgi:hypothetical protein